MTDHNKKVLEGLEPQKVFSYFGEIASIPHGSGNEERLSKYIEQLGKEKKWEVHRDNYSNVVIKKPATPGYENSPTLMMQAHLDMVCEKDPGVDHDFLKDPLKLRREDGFIYATGTTLGADNGIGVALLLAILDTAELEHPALEILLTADEEAGMSGIQNFDGSLITAHHLLNLDSKMDSLTVACAGGQRFSYCMPYQTAVSQQKKTVSITVDGLKGGHSGAEIDKGRGNAIKLLGRIVEDLQETLDVEVVILEADGKANVIPKRACAKVNTADTGILKERIAWWNNTLRHELEHSDGDVSVSADEIDFCGEVMCRKDARRLLQCIRMIPSGTLVRNLDSGEAVYSNNLGAVQFEKGSVHLLCLARSSVPSLISTEYLPLMSDIAEVFQIEGKVGNDFPCWEYVEDSPLREICAKTYFELNGNDPEIISRHAGSECGYIIEKCPTLQDAVATGARLFKMHTTEEHLDIGAVGVAFRYLCEILKGFKALG